jgi:uncharacterized protein
MKYLTVFAVLAIAFWIWRNNRRSEAAPPSPKANAAQSGVQPMLQCAVCGVHLPESDVITGKQGRYCSAEHRKQLEG